MRCLGFVSRFSSRSLRANLAVGGRILGSLLLASCSADPGSETTPAQGSDLGAPLATAAGRIPSSGARRPRGVYWRSADDTHPKIDGPKCPNSQLQYFGGPIVQAPIIVPVFWNSDVDPQVQQQMPQFYADVTQSSYWAWLSEYDTLGQSGSTGQVFSPGTVAAGTVLKPSQCPAGSGGGIIGGCNLDDSLIQSELTAQINAGALPKPSLDCTGNVQTIYMVHLPPAAKLSFGSSGNACTDFCAYHFTGTYGTANTPLIYGVLMDYNTGPCGSVCAQPLPTALERTTMITSHELVEAATDPDVGLDPGVNYSKPAAWAQNGTNCPEIADICEGNSDMITVSGRSWEVQDLWSNAQNSCTSTGPAKTCASGYDCGTMPNGCAAPLDCGTCAANETCSSNVCVPTSSSSSSSSSSAGTASSSSSGTTSSSGSGTASSSSSGTTSSSSSGTTGSSSSGGVGGASTSSGAGGGAGGAAGGPGSGVSTSASTAASSAGGGRGTTTASSTGSSGTTNQPNKSGGCGCKTAGEPAGTPAIPPFTLGMLAIAALRRRRRGCAPIPTTGI